ncbi:MAG: hypothetical protein ACR2ML_01400 [Solirubrobacteraceae bacterium]
MIFAESYTGWWVGLTLGFLVVVVVVLLVSVLLTAASRIADQAGVAGDALESVREQTDALGSVGTVNQSAVAILEAARAARGALTGT